MADVEAGRTTRIVSPEPAFLEGFVRDQPQVAAKITTVDVCMGNVSDVRFGSLRRLLVLRGGRRYRFAI